MNRYPDVEKIRGLLSLSKDIEKELERLLQERHAIWEEMREELLLVLSQSFEIEYNQFTECNNQFMISQKHAKELMEQVDRISYQLLGPPPDWPWPDWTS